MSQPDNHFYRELEPFDDFGDVASQDKYGRLPDTWHVAVTDIDGSTDAIEQGRYKEVNAIGAGCIVAATNAVDGLDFPYVFGGDGATILLPAAALDPVRAALAGVANLADRLFGLDLRVGIVPATVVRDQGGELSVAKYRLSDSLSLAMLAGGGAELAEAIIKDPERGAPYRLSTDEIARATDVASLDGFNCRWNPIDSKHGTVVSLLVVATSTSPEVQRETYRGVIETISSLGDADAIRPVDVESMTLGTSPDDFQIEAGMRIGRMDGVRAAAYRTTTAIQTRIGNRLMKTGGKIGSFDGERYPTELEAHTDFRKFDDALRMVLDLSPEQLDRLDDDLGARHRDGTLAYGIHESDAALMTCLVLNHDGQHVHFVDGANGGYALAARQLKEQLASLG